MVCTGRVVLVLALVLYWGYRIVNSVELMKTVTPTKHTCYPLRGPLGAEDLVKWKGLVLTSNMDSLPLWNWPNPQNPSVSKYVSLSQLLTFKSQGCPSRLNLGPSWCWYCLAILGKS